MNFARTLLASAAIAVLAACSSDSITAPDAPRRSSSAVEDVTVESSDSELDDQNVSAGECLIITTTVGGVTTTVNTCMEMGPHISGGGS